jgi:hypothetical protein
MVSALTDCTPNNIPNLGKLAISADKDCEGATNGYNTDP